MFVQALESCALRVAHATTEARAQGHTASTLLVLLLLVCLCALGGAWFMGALVALCSFVLLYADVRTWMHDATTLYCACDGCGEHAAWTSEAERGRVALLQARVAAFEAARKRR